MRKFKFLTNKPIDQTYQGLLEARKILTIIELESTIENSKIAIIFMSIVLFSLCCLEFTILKQSRELSTKIIMTIPMVILIIYVGNFIFELITTRILAIRKYKRLTSING